MSDTPTEKWVSDTAPDTVVQSPGSQGEHLLQSVYGTAERAGRFYRDQMCNRLLPTMVEFVGRMEMMFVATADGHGECDATIRAGPAGFVHVLDEGHLAYPEYRGNGVLASLGNISENPHVGLLMIDFVRDLIGLHVNGRARIVEDGDLRAAYPNVPAPDVPGRRAKVWVVVDVEEAYVHCRKHIPPMMPVPHNRAWGSDDVRRKGGDYFGAAAAAPASGAPISPASGNGEAEPTSPRSFPDRLAGWWARRVRRGD
jgi:uncharacterized protein